MFKLVKTQVRTKTDIPFFFQHEPMPQELIAYVEYTYRKTGKLIKSSTELSTDGLTCIFTTWWNSMDDFLEYATDNYCSRLRTGPNTAYDIANDIISDFESEEN